MDGSIAKGLGAAFLMVMIIAFIIGGLPTFFIAKSVYYKKGYNSAVEDFASGKVKRDTTVTIKWKKQ